VGHRCPQGSAPRAPGARHGAGPPGPPGTPGSSTAPRVTATPGTPAAPPPPESPGPRQLQHRPALGTPGNSRGWASLAPPGTPIANAPRVTGDPSTHGPQCPGTSAALCPWHLQSPCHRLLGDREQRGPLAGRPPCPGEGRAGTTLPAGHCEDSTGWAGTARHPGVSLSQPWAAVVAAAQVTVTAAGQGTPVPATATLPVFAHVVPTVPGQHCAIAAVAIPCAVLWQHRGFPAVGTCWGSSVAQPWFRRISSEPHGLKCRHSMARRSPAQLPALGTATKMSTESNRLSLCSPPAELPPPPLPREG